MPDEIYRTKFEPPSAPDTLVIHCSDPTYQPHFQEFLREHLGLASYALLAVPGGPQFLTLTDYLPKFAWVGWRWITFLFGVASPARVVLIAHDECRWYEDSRFAHLGSGERQQKSFDFARVRKEIHSRYPNTRVDAYHVRLESGRGVFEKD